MDARSPRLVLTNGPDEAAHRAIIDPLLAFNIRQAGAHDCMPLAVLIQEHQTGQVNGGLWGRTSWKWLTIETLFVPELYRASGVGSMVMQMAEQEAIKRGCIGALVDTHSFQAPGFYEKLGYRRFGEIANCPPGHSRIFFEKRFSAAIEGS